jgi:hypothetical protein
MRNATRLAKVCTNLRTAAEVLRDLDTAREEAIQCAFGVLEQQHATLARLAVHSTGNRQRAARWMCMHQRAFEGRSAYDLLAEGDIDAVWDRLSGEDEAPGAESARVAY